ncbi:isoflavone reductase homolog [Rhodamnia argentea]|uniref:Isoflavone reductase homolog n=1 Tax=Rhodamnia argentea TaxID=178133 RepID=A0A8B8PKT1_9MYRT|nr:isoflavone reductase homolog [Rhodamnia argentea]
MEINKSKVLIVGGTGYVGRRIVKASLQQGHETYVLQRRELGLYDIEKVQMLLSFKRLGARLVEASFSDHRSLVEAVRLADVVVCAMSGVPFRSHNILLQLKLVDAIKEAGNVKRFLPSEFGMDAGRMGHALAPGRITFDDKVTVRKAIEEARIPYTYVSANCFAGYFIGGLCDFNSLTPPKGKVHLYGDGNVKAIFVDEDDVGTYTIKAIDDPRTLNKTLYLRPSDNILSQRQLVEMYESLSGKRVETVLIPEKDFLASMAGLDYIGQIGVGHYYHIFYEGSLTNFEIGAGGVEASELYPEVRYTRMDDYMKQYL